MRHLSRRVASTSVRLLGLMLTSLSIAALALLSACSRGETGSVTLSWTPPTENEDGTKLDDLAGYRVYWRQSNGPIEQVVVIDNPSSTEFEIEGLTDGKWHVGVTAFTEAALESDLATAVLTMRDGQATLERSTLGRIVTRAQFAEPAMADGSVAR